MTPADRLRFKGLLTDQQAEALTAYGEARGETVLGIIAIISVIRNRARMKGTRSIDQAMKTAAFSCWLDQVGSANNDMLADLATMLITAGPRPNDAILDVCLYLSVRQNLSDPTGGATHYYNAKAVDHTPTWIRPPAIATAVIGNHQFFKNVAF